MKSSPSIESLPTIQAGKQEIPASKFGGRRLIALLVVCLGMLVYGFFSRHGLLTRSPAFLAGRYLATALLVWVVFYALFTRKRGVMINAVAFGAIYGSLFLGGLLGNFRQKQQTVALLDWMQQELERAKNNLAVPGEVPPRSESNPATALRSKGEFGEMEQWGKEYIDRSIAQRNDYVSELSAIGWDSILNAQRLKNDASLSESKMIIEKATAVVDKYAQKSKELFRNNRARINTLAMSEATRKAALAGFDSTNSEAQIDEKWKLEKQVILQFGNIIKLLSSSRGWTIEGDKILFDNDSDLALFNACMQEIQQIGQQQDQMQERDFAKANENLEKFKNVLGR
jgi:hypothetical protein